jgi:hypothetical protein
MIMFVSNPHDLSKSKRGGGGQFSQADALYNKMTLPPCQNRAKEIMAEKPRQIGAIGIHQSNAQK